jgi:galactose mutarotase-like enzyme
VTELIAISSGKLAAKINPIGAELWSLADVAGREYMTDADPAFWTGHAPILFPIVGGLKDDTYRLDGREYTLRRHGFARRSAFAVVEQRDHAVRLRLTDDATTWEVYPFAFELELAYRLSGSRLEIEALVRNRGEAVLPFSLGFHPAFAWPLPGGGEKLAHAIVFAHEETGEIKLLDEVGLLSGREASPVHGNRLALAPELFARDALIWEQVAGHSLDYLGEHGRPRLRIDYPDTPSLGIWQKPGASFLCIEPWQGHADEAGFAGDFRDKPGVVQLAPGHVRSFRVDVTVDPA